MSATNIGREGAVSPTTGAAAHPERLQRDSLSLLDVATSTMANIGPAMSFYFGFAVIAAAAGVASPLAIILAAVAIALLGNTLSEFSRSLPSAGSFITFIGKAFGPVVAIVTTIVIGIGYIAAGASVIVISGGWTQITLQHYLHINLPWQLLTLVLTGIVFYLVVRGVSISTQWAGIFFLFEMAILMIVSIAVLVTHASHLSLAPFNPAHLSGGLAGLGLGFPLAIYILIGWENSASLAEETSNPRRNVPRAIFLSILVMTVTYLLLAYSTIAGFNYSIKALSAADVPFIVVAQSTLGFFVFLAYLAGFTSTMACLIAAANAQSRLIFSAGREGLLPKQVAIVGRRGRTPWVSLAIYLGVGLLLVYIFGWSVPPVTFFGEIATLGSIMVVLTYLASNVALPFYYRKYHPEQFSAVRHVLLPVLGVIAIAYPLWGLIQPGQPAPYNAFPWITLAIIVVALVYGLILNARDRTLGHRIGSIVADHD